MLYIIFLFAFKLYKLYVCCIKNNKMFSLILYSIYSLSIQAINIYIYIPVFFKCWLQVIVDRQIDRQICTQRDIRLTFQLYLYVYVPVFFLCWLCDWRQIDIYVDGQIDRQIDRQICTCIFPVLAVGDWRGHSEVP